MEGVTACCGNPTWLETHAPAARTAPAVAALLDAGATLVGVTLTDELALSLTGENAHYGTPINIRCPDRVPGGSSSGSAAAVAARLCDFALGTDTGGSVRVPASHCGIYGFRPTHGAVATDGVCPLAPRFDTVGWFARDATTLARVGERLLPADARRDLRGDLRTAAARRRPPTPPRFSMRRRAACSRAPPSSLAARLGTRTPETVRVADTDAPATDWCATYLTLQNAQAAALHGDWIARHRPRFGSLIAGRFAGALAVDEIARRARREGPRRARSAARRPPRRSLADLAQRRRRRPAARTARRRDQRAHRRARSRWARSPASRAGPRSAFRSPRWAAVPWACP